MIYKLLRLLNLPKIYKQEICGKSNGGHTFTPPLNKLPRCTKCGILLEDYIDIYKNKEPQK